MCIHISHILLKHIFDSTWTHSANFIHRQSSWEHPQTLTLIHTHERLHITLAPIQAYSQVIRTKTETETIIDSKSDWHRAYRGGSLFLSFFSAFHLLLFCIHIFLAKRVILLVSFPSRCSFRGDPSEHNIILSVPYAKVYQFLSNWYLHSPNPLYCNFAAHIETAQKKERIRWTNSLWSYFQRTGEQRNTA